ncbi:MAG: hypothetical protein K0R38_7833 [Polyangiaceae bacterium]|nr:hypothetical protein [Polyangiaceae bacterium]
MDLEDIARVFEWDAIIDESSYYEILGLLEIADGGAIRVAFHEFAASFHPLSRPDSRSDYDLALAKGLLRLDTPIAPPPLTRSSDIRSLDELCRSPGARRYARKAEERITAGDLTGAKRELQMALREDGDNADLAERLDAIDLALFAMGS